MAKPLDFTPAPLKLNSAFASKVERAPQEHSEALLNFYALIQEAHDHGWLDAARGAIAGAPTAASEIAKYASTSQSITAMRNAITLAKILGAIDPEVLNAIDRSIQSQAQPPRKKTKVSLWKLFRSLGHPDVLRGAAFGIALLGAIGKTLEKRQ